MKKLTLESMMTLLLAVVFSMSFTSCGSDSDDDSTGSGKAPMTIDGKSYSMPYAYYVPGGESEDGVIMFSNLNIMNPSSISRDSKWTYCVINIKGLSGTTIPTGEFTSTVECFVNQDLQGSSLEIGVGCRGNVVVSKSGNGYSLTFTSTLIEDFEGVSNVSSVSISFSGTLIDSSSIWQD